MTASLSRSDRGVARTVLRTTLAGVLFLVVTLLATRVGHAQDRPTLSGTWSASAMTERWNIGDWGDACGPRPAPRGAAGGSVTITESGGELAFSGGGYPRTNNCFEQGFGVTSHSASARFWRTRCGTSANDPRKATIVTSVSATDTSISFDETGEYQFILKEQNCTASVRRSRSYSLVRRLGEEPPAASTAPPVPAPTPTPTPTPTPPPAPEKPASLCTNVGEVARVEVRPARKLMKPGETFPLKAALLDEDGCRVPQLPTWSVPADAGIAISNFGVVTVASDAKEGEVVVSAGVNGRAAKVTIEVVSPDRYAALLAGGSAADTDDVAVAIVTTSGMGARSATASDSSRRRKMIFLGIVGGAVVLLGVAGVVLHRRQKPELEAVEELIPGETKLTVVRKKRLVRKEPPAGASAVAPPAAEGSMVCPTCGKHLIAGTAFCPDDGSRLVVARGPSAPPPPAAAASGAAKICPVCGVRYAATAQFCGREGATLVLVN